MRLIALQDLCFVIGGNSSDQRMTERSTREPLSRRRSGRPPHPVVRSVSNSYSIEPPLSCAFGTHPPQTRRRFPRRSAAPGYDLLGSPTRKCPDAHGPIESQHKCQQHEHETRDSAVTHGRNERRQRNDKQGNSQRPEPTWRLDQAFPRRNRQEDSQYARHANQDRRPHHDRVGSHATHSDNTLPRAPPIRDFDGQSQLTCPIGRGHQNCAKAQPEQALEILPAGFMSQLDADQIINECLHVLDLVLRSDTHKTPCEQQDKWPDVLHAGQIQTLVSQQDHGQPNEHAELRRIQKAQTGERASIDRR